MRNHFTLIFERLGLALFLPLLFGFSWLQNSLSDIFMPAFWADAGSKLMRGESFFITLAAPAYLLVLLGVLFSSLLYWLRTSFYLEEGFFVFERKTFFRKRAKLPLNNIATVNLERNFFQRLAGTARVKLDLNSAHTANRTDFVLVLPLKTAESFRDRLLELKQAEAGRAAEEAEDRRLLLNFPPLSALRHKLLSAPLFQTLIGAFVLISTLYEAAQKPGNFKNLIALLVLVGSGLIFSLVYGVLNLSDFCLKTDSENFYIISGRFRKTEYAFAHKRINALIIKQPLLARIFSLSYLEAAVVGLGNERSETPRLSLLVDSETLSKLTEEQFEDFGSLGEQIPSHRAAFLPLAFRVMSICLGIYLFSELTYGDALLPLLTAFILTTLGGYLSYKTKSLAFYENQLHYSKGIFTKQRALFKYSDIQDARIISNPLMEKFGVGRLNFHILSSAGMRSHKTGWFKLDVLKALSEKIADSEDSSTSLFE